MYIHPMTPRYSLPTPTAQPFLRRIEQGENRPLTPDALYSTYGLQRNMHAGAGKRLALVSAFGAPDIQIGVDRFSSEYGLPGASVQLEAMGGSTACEPDWCLESDADVQWAHAVCPGAALLCVFAHDATIGSLIAAMRRAASMGADIVSVSFGSAEFFGELALSAELAQSEAVFVASGGDSGGVVLFPSASDMCLSVGGVQLGRQRERITNICAWRQGGGGPSKYTGIPVWQERHTGIKEQTAGYRGTPDVALEACPVSGYSVYDTQKKRFCAVCGTSVAAPCFAGICARQELGRTTQEVAQNIYRYTKRKQQALRIFDVRCGSNGRYSAMPGYDLCTGLGMPYVHG